VPGDKSISHRYAMLAAIASGRSVIRNFAPGADCLATRSCLEALGIEVSGTPAAVTIIGRGPGGLSSPGAPLDARNSGTTTRLLAGLLSAHAFASTITGDASLCRRPMRRVILPLARMGARFEARDGCLPMTIVGGELQAIDYRTEVPSAQVKSAVLLAGLHATGTTRVTESHLTRDHTELALRQFGGTIHVDGTSVSIPGRQRLTAADLTVPGDLSSAAFWLVAAAGLAGSAVEVEDVGLNPTRSAVLDVLRRAGARVDCESSGVGAAEPRGRIRVEHRGLSPLVIAPTEVPGLIDELPALAALATFGGDITVTGASELRVKESDRITALVTGLRRLGADADELPDGFHVSGARPLAGGVADAAGDHRLAMAFAVAALGARRPSTIVGAEVVDVSYPGFFETLAALGA
jgi:3-phosphoshikimate 1-carboxyvinyltransferase